MSWPIINQPSASSSSSNIVYVTTMLEESTQFHSDYVRMHYAPCSVNGRRDRYTFFIIFYTYRLFVVYSVCDGGFRNSKNFSDTLHTHTHTHIEDLCRLRNKSCTIVDRRVWNPRLDSCIK